MTTKNPLRPQTKIVVSFPLWNPSETNQTLIKHMIKAIGEVKCVPKLGMGPFVQCAYNNTLQLLTLSRPVETESLPNTQMAFEIESFRNPYNGKPRNGFTVITMDSDGGLIDSSVVGGIDITLTVTEFAALTLVNIMRYEITEASMIANDITISTTIREESAGKIEIIMDLPVDPHCRIEIKFPQDMPLTADFK